MAGNTERVMPEDVFNASLVALKKLKYAQLRKVNRSIYLPYQSRKADCISQIRNYMLELKSQGQIDTLYAIKELIIRSERDEELPHLNEFVDIFNSKESTSNEQQSSKTRQAGFFKKSHFYTYKKMISAHDNPQIAKKAPDSRGTCRMQFNLDSKEREELKKPNIKLYMFCGVLDDSKEDRFIEFPQPSKIYVNKEEIPGNTKGIKGKIGSVKPLDITVYVKLKEKNYLDMIYAYTEKDYIVYLYIIEVTPIERLVTQVLNHEHIPKETTVKMIEQTEQTEQEDIHTSKEIVTLLCPCSYTRMQQPVRSVKCKHIQCFDLFSYISLQEKAPTWICPICSHRLKLSYLAIDDYFDSIIKNTGEDIDFVELQNDGTWEPKALLEENIANGSKKSEISVKHESESSKVNLELDENGEIQVISLDSDDEDAPAPEKKLTDNTPETSQEPSNSLAVLNKPVTIDLLSDTEEDENGAVMQRDVPIHEELIPNTTINPRAESMNTAPSVQGLAEKESAITIEKKNTPLDDFEKQANDNSTLQNHFLQQSQLRQKQLQQQRIQKIQQQKLLQQQLLQHQHNQRLQKVQFQTQTQAQSQTQPQKQPQAKKQTQIQTPVPTQIQGQVQGQIQGQVQGQGQAQVQAQEQRQLPGHIRGQVHAQEQPQNYTQAHLHSQTRIQLQHQTQYQLKLQEQAQMHLRQKHQLNLQQESRQNTLHLPNDNESFQKSRSLSQDFSVSYIPDSAANVSVSNQNSQDRIPEDDVPLFHLLQQKSLSRGNIQSSSLNSARRHLPFNQTESHTGARTIQNLEARNKRRRISQSDMSYSQSSNAGFSVESMSNYIPPTIPVQNNVQNEKADTHQDSGYPNLSYEVQELKNVLAKMGNLFYSFVKNDIKSRENVRKEILRYEGSNIEIPNILSVQFKDTSQSIIHYLDIVFASCCGILRSLTAREIRTAKVLNSYLKTRQVEIRSIFNNNSNYQNFCNEAKNIRLRLHFNDAVYMVNQQIYVRLESFCHLEPNAQYTLKRNNLSQILNVVKNDIFRSLSDDAQKIYYKLALKKLKASLCVTGLTFELDMDVSDNDTKTMELLEHKLYEFDQDYMSRMFRPDFQDNVMRSNLHSTTSQPNVNVFASKLSQSAKSSADNNVSVTNLTSQATQQAQPTQNIRDQANKSVAQTVPVSSTPLDFSLSPHLANQSQNQMSSLKVAPNRPPFTETNQQSINCPKKIKLFFTKPMKDLLEANKNNLRNKQVTHRFVCDLIKDKIDKSSDYVLGFEDPHNEDKELDSAEAQSKVQNLIKFLVDFIPKDSLQIILKNLNEMNDNSKQSNYLNIQGEIEQNFLTTNEIINAEKDQGNAVIPNPKGGSNNLLTKPSNQPGNVNVNSSDRVSASQNVSVANQLLNTQLHSSNVKTVLDASSTSCSSSHKLDSSLANVNDVERKIEKIVNDKDAHFNEIREEIKEQNSQYSAIEAVSNGLNENNADSLVPTASSTIPRSVHKAKGVENDVYQGNLIKERPPETKNTTQETHNRQPGLEVHTAINGANILQKKQPNIDNPKKLSVSFETPEDDQNVLVQDVLNESKKRQLQAGVNENETTESETKILLEKLVRDRVEREMKSLADRYAKLRAENEAGPAETIVLDEVTEKEAKLEAERQAKLNAEREVKENIEREAKLKAEREAVLEAKREAELEAKREAELKSERKAKEDIEREAKLKVEREAKLKAEREAKLKAKREADFKIEREAKAKADKIAKDKAEAETKLKLAREAKEKADREGKERAENERKEKINRENRQKALQEAKERARRKANELLKEKAEKEKDERDQKTRAESEIKEKPKGLLGFSLPTSITKKFLKRQSSVTNTNDSETPLPPLPPPPLPPAKHSLQKGLGDNKSINPSQGSLPPLPPPPLPPLPPPLPPAQTSEAGVLSSTDSIDEDSGFVVNMSKKHRARALEPDSDDDIVKRRKSDISNDGLNMFKQAPGIMKNVNKDKKKKGNKSKVKFSDQEIIDLTEND